MDDCKKVNDCIFFPCNKIDKHLKINFVIHTKKKEHSFVLRNIIVLYNIFRHNIHIYAHAHARTHAHILFK